MTAQLTAPDAGLAAAQGTDFFAVDALLTDAGAGRSATGCAGSSTSG